MDENKIMDIEVDGLSEEEARGIQEIFQRFIDKYQENPDRDVREWLQEQLRAELPEKGEEEIRKLAEEIAESMEEYNRDLDDLDSACRKGVTKESWFAEKIQDSAKGMAVNQFGDCLNEMSGRIDRCLELANQQMEDVLLRQDLEVKLCTNLDGFIAEQYHVNNFNAKAALENLPYRARVCVPEHGYAKNSVDVMIDNLQTNEKGIERYQLKFGKDADATIRMLKRGDYANQRIVVPSGQVEEVKQAFPGKSVTDHIGGTKKVPIQSDPVTKEQMKELQSEAQEQGLLAKTDWNSYQTRELAFNIGKKAGKAGLQAALFGIGFNLAKKVIRKEKVEVNETVKTALESGSDAGIKCAAGGALKVASEKGILSIVPPGTPAGTLTKIACMGVENAKIMWKTAKGELTVSEAAERMGRTSVSLYAGMSASVVGMQVGAVALSWIPIVGPLVGGLAGGMVGYAAGSKVGEKAYEGAKKVVKKAAETVKAVGRAIAALPRKLSRKAKKKRTV